jgi:HD superfamily phosphohydrolase
LSDIHTEVGVAYEKAGLASEWPRESAGVLRLLEELQGHLKGAFTFVGALGVGGTGIALKLADERLTTFAHDPVHSVVKIPRPFFEPIIAQESERLVGLRYENLIRVQMTGITPDTSTPFFVMEAVENADDADRWLIAHPSMTELVRILQGTLSGVLNLHNKGIAHLDIKPSNIFVSPEAVLVADLGFAKRAGISGMTARVGFTAGYSHPEYEELLAEGQQKGLKEYPRRDLKTSWDLYSIGVSLLVLLKILENAGEGVSEFAFRYLKLMAFRMLGDRAPDAVPRSRNVPVLVGSDKPSGRLAVETRYLGLNQAAFAALGYKTIEEAIDDLDKLTGRRDLLRSVPELQEFPRDVIQASSLGNTPFSPRIAKLIELPQVHRLSKVDQLGLVRLVYPTATHSRLEHSLGTLAMAARFTRALYNDPVSPLFRQFMNDSDIEVLLAVCLLHDIGHYPLAHDLEEVHDLFSHEARTLQLIESKDVVAALSSDLWSPGIAKRVSSVLRETDAPTRSIQDMLIRAVIDGPVDADKVDYLIRDSENLRLPYGRGVDVSKLLQSLTVIVKSGVGKDSEKVFARIGINDKGKVAAESVAFARYSMYGAVYWHRTHRTLKAMLNRLGFEALSTYEASLPPESQPRMSAALQKDLFKYISVDESTGRQLAIPDRLESVDGGQFFDARTEQVVLWLSRQVRKKSWAANPSERKTRPSTPAFERLAADILGRQLFDRVCVVTRSRGDWSKATWRKVDRIYGRTGAGWRRRLELTTNLEASLASAVREQLHPGASFGPLSEPETEFASDLLAAIDRGDPVLLVDFPPHKTGSKNGLEYRREDISRLGERDPFDVANVEPSTVWTQVSSAYRESLGKLRVFCHPSFSPFVARHFSSDRLQELMFQTLERTIQSMDPNGDFDDGDDD